MYQGDRLGVAFAVLVWLVLLVGAERLQVGSVLVPFACKEMLEEQVLLGSLQRRHE